MAEAKQANDRVTAEATQRGTALAVSSEKGSKTFAKVVEPTTKTLTGASGVEPRRTEPSMVTKDSRSVANKIAIAAKREFPSLGEGEALGRYFRERPEEYRRCRVAPTPAMATDPRSERLMPAEDVPERVKPLSLAEAQRQFAANPTASGAATTIIDLRARELMRGNTMTYGEAVAEIAQREPELYTAYRAATLEH